MDVTFGNPETNMQKIQDTLASLSVSPGTLLMLPELFLTGYHKSSLHQVAEDKKYSEELISIAQNYDIMIFGSLPTLQQHQIFNTAVFVTPQGIQASYKKSHLFGPMGEKQLFSPGREVTSFVHDNKHFGMSICYDLRFPEIYQEMAKNGVKIHLICAEWPITRIEHFRVLCRARAIETQAFVVALNRVGEDPDYRYGGHSVVYDPFGEVVTELSTDNEGTAECTLNFEKLTDFRSKFNVLDDKWFHSN